MLYVFWPFIWTRVYMENTNTYASEYLESVTSLILKSYSNLIVALNCKYLMLPCIFCYFKRFLVNLRQDSFLWYCGLTWAYCTSRWYYARMERWQSYNGKEKLEYSKKNISDCHVVHPRIQHRCLSFLLLFVAWYCCISGWIVSVVGHLLMKLYKSNSRHNFINDISSVTCFGFVSHLQAEYTIVLRTVYCSAVSGFDRILSYIVMEYYKK